MEKKTRRSYGKSRELSETPDIQIYFCSAGTIASRKLYDYSDEPGKRFTNQVQDSPL